MENNMKYKMICLSVLFLGVNAYADENNFRCFVSVGTKAPIRLQMNLPFNGHPGQATYQKGTGPIDLKLISEKELERVPGGRPSLMEMVYEEILKDGTGGKYVWDAQGAVTVGFKYVRKKDGKEIKFEENQDLQGENNCEWDRPAQK